jgi:hypothetical protein
VDVCVCGGGVNSWMEIGASEIWASVSSVAFAGWRGSGDGLGKCVCVCHGVWGVESTAGSWPTFLRRGSHLAGSVSGNWTGIEPYLSLTS